jgi:hypothetical protein
MPAPDYNTLYQFEPLISATLDSMFNAASLTPKSIVSDPKFQSNRPRVESVVTIGARFDNHYVFDADGNRRENGWHGSFQLTAITWADVKIHFAYLAAIRELAARVDNLELTDPANAPVPLLYHEIQQVKTAGTQGIFKPQDGVYQSVLNYDFNFAIRVDAWPGGLQSK